jgi:hypothetical protein
MLFDYMDMANHLLALGLHKKVGLETHYYPLALDDTSGKPKPIPADRAHNTDKAERLVAKTSKRERNRANDLLHKKIHGKDSAIKPFIDGYHLGVEDLSKTTKEVLRDDHGRKFNAKMSSWIHGRFRDIITHHHPDSKPYYTRGSSRFCPFDDTRLTHPSWSKSKCKTCNRIYDRDRLESVMGLVRTLPPRHLKGQPWKTAGEILPEMVVRRLQQGCTLLQPIFTMTPTDVGMGTSLRAVMPSSLFAPNVLSAVQATSDIGIVPRGDAMLGNRHDADEGSLNKLDTTQGLSKDTPRVCLDVVGNRTSTPPVRLAHPAGSGV